MKRSDDHVDRLYQIVNLAKVEAASTDTTLDTSNIEGAQCSFFEVIHNFASQALEIAGRS